MHFPQMDRNPHAARDTVKIHLLVSSRAEKLQTCSLLSWNPSSN